MSHPLYHAGMWQQPTPPPKRRYSLGVVLTVGIAAVLVAGSAGILAGASLRPAPAKPVAAAAAAPATGDADTPTAPTGSSPDASTLADGKALLAKVLPAPAGASAVTVKGTTDGVMDVDQFAAKFFTNQPDLAKATLRRRNFKVAAQRNWVGTDGVQVGLQLIEFATEADAQGYVLSQINAYKADKSVTDTFEIPEVTLGNGFERPALDAAGNHRAVLVAQSGFLAVFIFFYPPGDYDRAAEMALMHQQLDKIVF